MGGPGVFPIDQVVQWAPPSVVTPSGRATQLLVLAQLMD
jgi:hypothetical protein